MPLDIAPFNFYQAVDGKWRVKISQQAIAMLRAHPEREAVFWMHVEKLRNALNEHDDPAEAMRALGAVKDDE